MLGILVPYQLKYVSMYYIAHYVFIFYIVNYFSFHPTPTHESWKCLIVSKALTATPKIPVHIQQLSHIIQHQLTNNIFYLAGRILNLNTPGICGNQINRQPLYRVPH